LFGSKIRNPISLQIQEQHHLPQTTHSIIGSWRMEQLNISLETIHDMQRLVEGKISLDEALDGIKQRMAEK
jgi:hypothetical protein